MKTAPSDRLAVAAGLLLMPVLSSAGVDLRLTVASGYLHRGLDYDQSALTYQGSLEYQGAGWFAGLWASNVSVGAYDQRSSEIDYYLGYSRRWSDTVALEATVVRYTFQGSSPRDDDWTELQISAYLGDRWMVTWGIADNWWATQETTRFVEGTFRHPLPGQITLDLTVGQQLARHAAGIRYGYTEAGLSRPFHDLVLRVGYAAAQNEARQRFPGFADDQWIASLTWQP